MYPPAHKAGGFINLCYLCDLYAFFLGLNYKNGQNFKVENIKYIKYFAV